MLSDVTGFGSFDNSTCKRVLDLLERVQWRNHTSGVRGVRIPCQKKYIIFFVCDFLVAYA